MAVRFTRTAVIAAGRRDEAMEFAATIGSYFTENFGVDVIWGMDVGGTLGTIRWYSDYESLSHLEETIGRVMTDEGYLKLTKDAGELFAAPPEDTISYLMSRV